jgi:hypothetical protein
VGVAGELNNSVHSWDGAKLSVVQFGSSEWKTVQQRVPVSVTACHLGRQRPWFVCSADSNVGDRGHRAAILYCIGELFACRRCCYDFSYAGQHRAPLHHGLEQAGPMRLGGNADLLVPFPAKLKGMHRRTFRRLRARAEEAVFGR